MFGSVHCPSAKHLLGVRSDLQKAAERLILPSHLSIGSWLLMRYVANVKEALQNESK